MIFKNIELHNVVEVEKYKDTNAYEMFRVPKAVRDRLDMGEQAFRMSTASTGVEFRFVIKSGKAILRLRKKYTDKNFMYSHTLHVMHIFYGDIQGTWADHNRYLEDEVFDIVIEKPQNMPLLKEFSKQVNCGFDCEVVRVILDTGYYLLEDVIGDVEPPKKEQCPQNTLITYGSSITHGSNALDQSHAWASLLARNIKYDLRNVGMAGACAMEKEMVDFIADIGVKGEWNKAILELGINVVGMDNKYIYDRVKYTVSEIAGKNPNKKVYVISPFYCNDDFYNNGNATRWREIIPKVIKELNLSNVQYIDGLSVLDNCTYLCADEVHPNIYGVQKIYEKLKEIVK